MLKISTKGVAIIKAFEGLRLKSYNLGDSNIPGKPLWTIGYGTTLGITAGLVITKAKATKLLKTDLPRFESAVRKHVKVELNQNEFDALVSFTYNVGEAALARSTLLKYLNAGRKDQVPAQLSRWNKDNGKTLRGLVRRRAAEAQLFVTPVRDDDEIIQQAKAPAQIGPANTRNERDSLKESRIMKAGGIGSMGGIVAGGSIAMEKAEILTDKVQWFAPALSVLVIIGLSAAIIGGLWAMYCRRSDWLKAKS